MKIIILAAGKGKRLNSEKFNLPKVLRELNGKPLIGYVLDSLSAFDNKDIYIVIGYLADKVIDYCNMNYKNDNDLSLNFVWQKEQLGTAHAIQMALDQFPELNNESIMVLMGDMPFIKAETILSFIDYHNENKNNISIISTFVTLPSSFGRIVRDNNGQLNKIVEVKDADESILKINEVNTGVALYGPKALQLIKFIKNDNNQKEYYLTDLIYIALEKKLKVGVMTVKESEQFLGINTQEDLEYASKILQGTRGN